jgi:hypothetical protein
MKGSLNFWAILPKNTLQEVPVPTQHRGRTSAFSQQTNGLLSWPSVWARFVCLAFFIVLGPLLIDGFRCPGRIHEGTLTLCAKLSVIHNLVIGIEQHCCLCRYTGQQSLAKAEEIWQPLLYDSVLPVRPHSHSIDSFAQIFVYSMSVDGAMRTLDSSATDTCLAGSKALDALDRLVTSTESFFHPSNSGTWTTSVCGSQTQGTLLTAYKLTTFVKYLTSEFLKRWKEEESSVCMTPVVSGPVVYLHQISDA